MVAAFATQNHLSKQVIHAIDHTLVEWVTNIISYSFNDCLPHSILIRFECAPNEVRIEVEDDGQEFNPLSRPPVDVKCPLENRSIGGLGIHMMRHLMDQVLYCRKNGKNIVTLIKKRN